jgi:uncharacterized protein YjiS (DUF1127 family)
MNTSHCLPARRDCGSGTIRERLCTAAGRLRLWLRRARERRELLRLDPRLCRDIGVTVDEARHEAAKPFWRD